MENRRQTYRHSFVPAEALRVELYRPGTQDKIDCDLLDLSLGGMRVRLRNAVQRLRAGDSVITHLLGREAPSPVELSLSLPSCVAHVDRHRDGIIYGVQFLPSANPGANEKVEKTLARFLIAEQRRLRRQAQATDDAEA